MASDKTTPEHMLSLLGPDIRIVLQGNAAGKYASQPLSQRAAPPALCQGAEYHLPDTHAHREMRLIVMGGVFRCPRVY